MKRFFAICSVIFVLTCSVLAAASGSTSPTPGTDHEEVDPLPDRYIPTEDITYIGDFPIVPVTSTSSYSDVWRNGLRVAIFSNSTTCVASTNSTVYCFSIGQKVYFATLDSSAEVYYTTSSSSASSFSFSSMDSSTGLYSDSIPVYFNSTQISSYIPSFSSVSDALTDLRVAIDENDPSEPDPTEIVDALNRTNDLLSGLIFFVGFSCGISSMRELWRRL